MPKSLLTVMEYQLVGYGVVLVQCAPLLAVYLLALIELTVGDDVVVKNFMQKRLLWRN